MDIWRASSAPPTPVPTGRSRAAAGVAHVAQVVDAKPTVFGTYQAVKPEKVAAQPADIRAEITAIEGDTKKETLSVVAIFPVIMFVCYGLLLLYFKSRGGYQQVHLEMERTNDMLGAPVGTVER